MPHGSYLHNGKITEFCYLFMCPQLFVFSVEKNVAFLHDYITNSRREELICMKHTQLRIIKYNHPHASMVNTEVS